MSFCKSWKCQKGHIHIQVSLWNHIHMYHIYWLLLAFITFWIFMNSLKVSEKTHSHSSFSSENKFTLHMSCLLKTISIDHILCVENISLNSRKDTFIFTSKFFLWIHLHMYHIYWMLTFFVVENLESVSKETLTLKLFPLKEHKYMPLYHIYWYILSWSNF